MTDPGFTGKKLDPVIWSWCAIPASQPASYVYLGKICGRGSNLRALIGDSRTRFEGLLIEFVTGGSVGQWGIWWLCWLVLGRGLCSTFELCRRGSVYGFCVLFVWCCRRYSLRAVVILIGGVFYLVWTLEEETLLLDVGVCRRGLQWLWLCWGWRFWIQEQLNHGREKNCFWRESSEILGFWWKVKRQD